MKVGKIGCALLVVASCAGARDAAASTIHVEDLTQGSCAAEAAWLGCPADLVGGDAADALINSHLTAAVSSESSNGLETPLDDLLTNREDLQMPEVPEPASLVLLGSGLFAIGSRFKRARSRS